MDEPTLIRMLLAEQPNVLAYILLTVRRPDIADDVFQATDPHWQTVALSPEPAWRVRPAVVLRGPVGAGAPNLPDAQWVTTTADKRADVGTGNYAFRTTVDLTGFDPATAAVRARGAAADQVADVLVNGVRTGASTPRSYPSESTVKTHGLAIRAAWLDGQDRVDVVMANLSAAPSNPHDVNPKSLQFG